MGMADPWGTADETSWEVRSNEPNRHLSFEDSFSNRNFEKLPDSSEYVSILERKLSRIKNKSTGSASANPNREIVRGLTALRADRMREFLGSSAAPLSTEVIGDNAGNDNSGMTDNSDPVYSSWMMQRLFPERQALSEEEIAALLRFDTLAMQHERALREAEQSTGGDELHVAEQKNSDDIPRS